MCINMLTRLWQQLEYRIDVCLVTENIMKPPVLGIIVSVNVAV